MKTMFNNIYLMWFMIFVLFLAIFNKSYLMIMTILSLEYFSVLLIFMVMINNNFSSNSFLLVLILLVFFSMESILMLTFYVYMIRYNSKDYNIFLNFK